MGLLLADLQSLANGARSDGRTSLASRFAPPLVLAAMHWLMGSLLLENRRILQLVDDGGDPLAWMLGNALSAGPVVAGWIGFALAQRQLFEAPELALWRSAPLPKGRAAMQVFLRALATALLWAAALCGPMLAHLLLVSGSTPIGFVAAAIAIVGVVAPPLCLVLTLQIVVMRFATGSASRAAMSAVSALAAFGFPIFLLAQVFLGGSDSAEAIARNAERGADTSRATAAAAKLVAECAAGASNASSWLAVLGPCAALFAVFAFAARMHDIAAQNHELARSSRKGRRSRWPTSAVAALRRKEFAQLLQQPGAIVHMLLVGAMVHLFASQGSFVGGFLAGDRMPPEMRQCAAMLMLWFLAALMLLYTHMGRLCAADGAQWPLYLQSPVSPATLLRGKLQCIGLLMLWPIAIAAWAGTQWLDAGWSAMAPFFALAAAGTVLALSIVAVIGTWPWLVRPEADGRLTQGSRGLVGSLTLVFSFYVAVSPALVAWVWLLDRFRNVPTHEVRESLSAAWPSLMLVAFGFAGLAFAIATPLARRNYARLLAPR